MAQLQHNMWVTNDTTSLLSIITGGGKWVEITIPADSLYQHLRSFGAASRMVISLGCSLLRPHARASRQFGVVDMTSSNAWAEFASLFSDNHPELLNDLA